MTGQAYCQQCKARLHIMGGMPVTCPCQWRKKAKPLPFVPSPALQLPNPIGLPAKSRCVYCGCIVTKKAEQDAMDAKTIDHFIPLGQGGRNKGSNRVKSCRACNKLKAAFNPAKWLEIWANLNPEGLQVAVEAALAKARQESKLPALGCSSQ